MFLMMLMAQIAGIEARLISIAHSLCLMASLTFKGHGWSLSSANLCKRASQSLVYMVSLALLRCAQWMTW